MSKNHQPRKGDKVWRELNDEDRQMGHGANGTIRKIDWTVDPPEYIVIFPAPTAAGIVSRQSYDRDSLGDWVDKLGGYWQIGMPTIIGSADSAGEKNDDL